MEIRKYAKIEIALQQIETALRLFPQEEELFSVITLAGAAEEILADLLDAKRAEQGRLLSVLKVLRPLGKKQEPQWLGTHETDAYIHTDARKEALFLLGQAIDQYRGVAGSVTASMSEFDRKYRGKT